MPYVELSKKDYVVAAVQIVRKQFEGYTKQEMEKLKHTRDMQGMAGHPRY